MIDEQEAEGSPRLAGLALVLGLTLALASCSVTRDLTESPEEKAAQQPKMVSTEGASDEFPHLSEVPKEPRPSIAPEQREQIMKQLMEDRAQATYTQPAPLETQASPEFFSQGGVIISGDGSTTTANRADFGPPLTTAAGGGQLAAIIFFGHGSSDLDARDRSVLRDVAALQQQRGGHLRVVGHASSRTQNTTPDEHQIANFDMSLIRAEAVQAELVALGVAPEAVQAEAVGDAEPVYHEFMPSGEAGNRRVEIFLEN
jgi:outer membrane protein OmpA-like peptidoglycan-associated protein